MSGNQFRLSTAVLLLYYIISLVGTAYSRLKLELSKSTDTSKVYSLLL